MYQYVSIILNICRTFELPSWDKLGLFFSEHVPSLLPARFQITSSWPSKRPFLGNQSATKSVLFTGEWNLQGEGKIRAVPSCQTMSNSASEHLGSSGLYHESRNGMQWGPARFCFVVFQVLGCFFTCIERRL